MRDWEEPRDYLADKRPVRRNHLKAVARELARRRYVELSARRADLLLVETGGETARLLRRKRALEEDGYGTLLIWIEMRSLAEARRRNRARRCSGGRSLPEDVLVHSFEVARRTRRLLFQDFQPHVEEFDNSERGKGALRDHVARVRAAVEDWLSDGASAPPRPLEERRIEERRGGGTRVLDRLCVGDAGSCFRGAGSWAVVHACKHPCHQRAVGYRGSLPESHPNHLFLEDSHNLYLNVVDRPDPVFEASLFLAFLAFCRRHWDAERALLIHCNRGRSRAPSLAILFLAKNLHVIDDSSFDQAELEFIDRYAAYSPATGIQSYLRREWKNLSLPDHGVENA